MKPAQYTVFVGGLVCAIAISVSIASAQVVPDPMATPPIPAPTVPSAAALAPSPTALAPNAAAAGPTTLWNFLGIPQGYKKIHDATFNRFGNFPKLERKPPLKRLADPANLSSPNDAIKVAAEIKMKEDMAAQKIKAIKYLAKVGCGGCYEGVEVAMLAALDDCTEKVRIEAAKAISEAAGTPCDACGGPGCCSAKVMTKLHELAYGKDESCCYLESSERVREAARKALEKCTRLVPPVEPGPERETSPMPRETVPGQGVPTPAPQQGSPFELLPGPKAPVELEEPSLNEPPPVSLRRSVAPPGDATAKLVNPINLRGLSRVDDVQSAHKKQPRTVRRQVSALRQPPLRPENSERYHIKLTEFVP